MCALVATRMERKRDPDSVTRKAQPRIARSLSSGGAERRPGGCIRGCGDYFFAGACGRDGGTVSISLPENTGAELGWPLGEPPACSTVTA